MERFYNPVTGYAKITFTYKNYTFSGEAQCHPQDHPNEFIGMQLANTRAFIKYFRFIRDNEIKPGLAALKQLYYSMKHSKNFNPKSYEAKMLYRQIRIKEDDLAEIKESIIDAQKQEKDIIRCADIMYKKINKLKKDQDN